MVHIVQTTDASYSPDVEIDHTGKLVYTRDIKRGETIRVPLHMFDKARKMGRPK